jgi:hypothetical protein
VFVSCQAETAFVTNSEQPLAFTTGTQRQPKTKGFPESDCRVYSKQAPELRGQHTDPYDTATSETPGVVEPPYM